MGLTAVLYDTFIGASEAKAVDLATDAVWVALVSSSYTPNIGTDQFWSTPQADELSSSGTGYTTGGQQLTSTTWTLNTTTGIWTYNAAYPQWNGATWTTTEAYYAVLYDKTSGSGASSYQLIGLVEDLNQAPSNQSFQIEWNANGIFTILA
jgi:hypothetical protein